mmetsp:Transcript_26994/g.62812  ORF Transcript_26994/g.62812 Transcript_26994/m.62812 type:complete len:113 (-) Transcript_26994:87-425(-)
MLRWYQMQRQAHEADLLRKAEALQAKNAKKRQRASASADDEAIMDAWNDTEALEVEALAEDTDDRATEARHPPPLKRPAAKTTAAKSSGKRPKVRMAEEPGLTQLFNTFPTA